MKLGSGPVHEHRPTTLNPAQGGGVGGQGSFDNVQTEVEARAKQAVIITSGDAYTFRKQFLIKNKKIYFFKIRKNAPKKKFLEGFPKYRGGGQGCLEKIQT